MQAFGPYASTETIDFTLLHSRTMFVISGKTGSGKTTIFDGISYAIYGKASGEDRNGQDLRSQFAKEELSTEVSLEFRLKNKVYLIKRSPQQEKKKDRGEGFKKVGATAELYTIDENGHKKLLAGNVREVDEKIKEIMLIDSNQFRQILMIPQGEFRKLLISDSKEKEVILQRLFHTELYKRIEDKLKEEATALKTSVEKYARDRDQAIRSISVLFKEELIKELNEEIMNDLLILPLLKEEIKLMDDHVQGLQKEALIKEAEKDKVQQQLFDAEAKLKQIQLMHELKQKKEQLEQQQEIIKDKEEQIVLAQKAAVLVQQEELCHRLKKELDHAQKNYELTTTRVHSAKEALKQWESELTIEKERETDRNAAMEAINHLRNMEPDVRSLAAVSTEVTQLKRELEYNKKENKTIEENLKVIENQFLLYQEEKKSIESGQQKYFEIERKLDKLEKEYELLENVELQQTRYLKARSVLKDSTGYFQHTNARFEDAKALVENLEKNWLHGQAAILASQLRPGHECPVCGSDHHPNPAIETHHEIPNEDDINAAKLQLASIEKEKREAESSLFKAQSTEKILKETLDDLVSKVALRHSEESQETDINILKQSVWGEKQLLLVEQQDWEKKLQRLEQLTEILNKLEKERETFSIQLRKRTEELNSVVIQFTEKNTVYTGMLDKVPENLRALHTFEKELQKALQHYEELIKRFEQVQQQYQQTKELVTTETVRLEETEKFVKEAEVKLTIEREAFVTKMMEQGFQGFASYHGAKKSAQEITNIQQEVRQYWEDYRSVSDRYNDLFSALNGVREPDVAGLTTVLQTIKNEIETLQKEVTQLLVKRNENKRIAEKVVTINEEIKSLEDKYDLIGDLYDISKGQNTYRITFERYVLASFLDDILREANARLEKMTNGRYELNRKTDRSKGNVQSGLELLVYDQYTGQERHVKTLSGGESFKASLSLALGLADVVQQYAGGVSLDTMFIDEGFGTLDPESLDQAIEALIDIQSTGRLVGIISHVPELKERIDARLEVIATQSGSTTEFYFING
jgi:DNA repair protein SbcC/Rad50